MDHINVFYGDVQALYDISLQVQDKQIVSLVGANGAGKSTTLRAISGIVPCNSGQITFLGDNITNVEPSRIVDMGLVQVPEGRELFPQMTVRENLELGSFLPKPKAKRADSLERVFSLFPRLKEREGQLAGTLSGGEQQMVAIGRGLMSLPKLLMLDEPSLGIAPVLVTSIFQAIQEINEAGVTILIVEQNMVKALNISSNGYVLETGKVKLTGTGQELLNDKNTQEAYLGM
ncbi:ABC transporter ATP-binding protein [Bacillus sp. JJ1773]|uniref:ABC transporter ATP-binding protein n=1 Tax=Bacillus sp. JJ1773 TaxID=3122965 RepID=UPI003F68A471